MSNKRILKLSFMLLTWIGLILLVILPDKAMAQSTAEKGSLLGFVYGSDQKGPLENAVVKIRRIGDKKEYQSGSTDENGFFQIKSIEEGRYILGITSGDEDFNFDYSVFIKAKEIAFLSFGLESGPLSSDEWKLEEMEKEIDLFFPQPAGKAVFDSSIAESVIGVYGAAWPYPRCGSPFRRFWRWLLWWLWRHWRR